MNIWQVAAPIVTDYITKSIGPKAVINDLTKTARILSRFGPRLPALVEAALIRQADTLPPRQSRSSVTSALQPLLGAAREWPLCC